MATNGQVAQELRGDRQVRAYARAMSHQLQLNKEKGDWDERPIEESVWQILYHAIKLCFVVIQLEPDPQMIQEFAADVGNEAMISADVLNTLESIYESDNHKTCKDPKLNLLMDELYNLLTKYGLLPTGYEPPPAVGESA